MPLKNNNQGQTNIDFMQALNKYIPSLVLQDLVERSQSKSTETLPRLQEMCTVTLFADISGFTNVSEACAKRGVRGNEELSFVINRYMEGMVKNFGKYGGDIIKFVGDAMIVMWPEDKVPAGTQDNDTLKNLRARTTIRKAIQCALDIQKEMNNFTVIQDVSSLSVKIGIGYGKCSLLYVGGVFGRAEFFTVGPALTYALKSEGQCTDGGQVMVSETAFQHVTEMYQAEVNVNKLGEKFFLISKLVGEGIKTRADALVLRSNISSETYSKIAQQLRGCVPAAIIPYLQINAEEFGSETRSLTVMFASLGVELSSAETKEGMQKIQKIVTCVQQQVYRHQGSVNKLVMDDKGSTLICLWGLSPMSHDDDAARAILTAINMHKELKKIDGTYCKIGISSGEMFSGVVGTSGGRKEFSVLGDVANLAARIMGGSQKGDINCDLNTRTMASNTFAFKYRGHADFKGKSISIPTFAVIWPDVELAEITKKPLEPWVFLKPWVNAMCPERDSQTKIPSYMRNSYSLLDTIRDLSNEIVEYFQKPKKQSCYMAAIKGDLGSGKTLFARFLIDELTQNDDFQELMSPKSILVSSLNSETQYSFLNIWKPILAQIITQNAKRDKQTREQILFIFLQIQNDPVMFQYAKSLCLLFQVSFDEILKLLPNPDIKQVSINLRTHPFVMRESYSEIHKANILRLIGFYIKLYIGEHSEQLGLDQKEQPLLFILDNTHLMDAVSWELLEIINESCSSIGIVLLQLSEQGELCINKDARDTFTEVWASKSFQDLHQIEMPPLDKNAFQNLLKVLSLNYKEIYSDEILKMTEIIDGKVGDGCKKTVQSGQEWSKILMKKWQIEQKFNQVDVHIVEVILKKCAGNPMLSLNYFVSLMQNGYTTMDINRIGIVEPTNKFQELIQMKDFTDVPVPRVAIKQNCQLIDRFVLSIQEKPNKRPGEFETCVKSIVMLKAATVLGEEFDSKSLHQINPLKTHESVQNLKKMLKILEANNFIEILDETDKDNFVCRFNKPFLRESIYQIVLYRDQKNTMHGAAAQYFLQEQGYSGGSSKDSAEQRAEIRTKTIRRHMLISQDIEKEQDLSYEARTGLTVNRILNLLQNKPNAVIKSEYITKQGQGTNKKTSDRLITIDSCYFRWYHNEAEMQSGHFLGSIQIQFIYQTVASTLDKGGNSSAFSISTSQWIDKHGVENGMRDFFFACSSDYEMEDWLITIEFLRTKAVYDAYASKNIPIQFPLRSGPTKQKQEQRKDRNALLYDFGGQLKQKTQISISTVNKSNIQVATLIPESVLKETVQKLKLLYNVGIVALSYQLTQTAAKTTVKQQSAVLGQLPDGTTKTIIENLGGIMYEPSAYTSQRSYEGGEKKKHVSDLSNNGSSISAKEIKQVKIQELDREKRKSEPTYDFAKSSPSTTPPQSIVQNVSNIIPNQTISISNTQQHLFEEQIAIIEKRRPEVDELFNQDEKVDRLRSQSPPGHHQRGHSTIDKQNSFLSDFKDVQHRSNPEFNEPNSIKLQDQTMLTSIQQLIAQQIEEGVSQLEQQNKSSLEKQSQELTMLLMQQQNQISQTLLNRSQFSMRSEPDSSVRHSKNKSTYSDLSPLKSFIGEVKCGGGITSKQCKVAELMSHKSKQAVDSDPEDPDFVKPKEQKKLKIKQKEQKSEQALLNFKDERLFYPPPTNWSNNDIAIYEQMPSNNKVMQISTDSEQDFKNVQQAVCIRSSVCQRKGNAFKIPEGTTVKIIEAQPQLKTLIIEYKSQKGLFLMRDFTKIIKTQPAIPKNKLQLSENFFKQVPERQLQQKLQQLTTEEIAKVSQRILDDKQDSLRLKNPIKL